jgi:hypothetical protein
MKARGVFAIIARMAVACAVWGKGLFNTRSHATGGSGKISNGRDAFMAVSAPKCHTQKKRYG